MAGVLAGPPAAWAARELSLLTAVNYAPTSDVKLAELAKRFARAAGVSVRVDHVQSVQMPAKIASEIMARSGHDIVSLEMHYPWLFQPSLADVSDLCTDLARKHGEWYPFLSWDNAGNNQWLNSGKGSWIHNPISHYVVAKQEKLPVAELTGFHPSPAGPAGRHTVGVPRSLGIWKFSKNVEVAKEFLRWFFEPAQYHEWIMAGDNYNHPVWRDMENHPVWDIDPKYKPLKSVVQYSHLYGWPAPPDERIQLITNSYVIPNMVARVVTNAASPKESMVWAETEIKRMFAR